MKIAILMPVYSGVHRKTVKSLFDMTVHTQRAIPGIELDLITESMSILLHLRQWLLEEAERRGAVYALWIDSDMTFPPDTLVRLLRHGKEFVGTNYRRRRDGEATTAGLDLWALQTTEEKAKAGILEEAKKVAFGLCLHHMDVVKKIREHAARKGGTPYPFFLFEQDDRRFISEDNYFGFKAREAGVRLYIDHALSWRVGHMGEREWRYDTEGEAVENAHPLHPATGSQ